MNVLKKRILSVCCVMVMVMCLTGVMTLNAKASEELPVIDGSYLTHEEESVGYDTKLTRGEDLLTGYSKCLRRGPELLYAGGTTIAAHTVEEVGVAVMVERAQEGDTQWEFCDAWQKFNKNADKAAINVILDVEGGYYYRVSCVHSANYDMSDSFTNGVFIEKKFLG